MARHLTYANVVATLALFIALGGGAYAAIKLPKNSVTTVQVKNGSLLAKDFRKGQLKAGRSGAQGPQGRARRSRVPGTAGPAGLAGQSGSDGLPRAPPGRTAARRRMRTSSGTGHRRPERTRASPPRTSRRIWPIRQSEYCIDGLSFTPRVAIVQPDVLSAAEPCPVAQVQTPSRRHRRLRRRAGLRPDRGAGRSPGPTSRAHILRRATPRRRPTASTSRSTDDHIRDRPRRGDPGHAR